MLSFISYIRENAEYKSKLDNLRSSLDSLGVDHALSHNPRHGILTISKMVVPKEDRNKGIGSKAMGLIKSHADEHGLKLDLTPSTHFGGTKSKLIKFYKRHGFKRNKSDFTSSEDMIREPS